MIAAVVSVALFGTLAIGAIRSGKSAIVDANANQVKARLSAAASAGLALAVHNLAAEDPAQRWEADGQARHVDFDGSQLTIAVEDESGKIPLNFVQPNVIRRLFELAGVAPAAVDPMVSAFRILRGDPGLGLVLSRTAVHPTHGPLAAIDELKLLPGMTPALYAQIAPAVTVAGTTLTFDLARAGIFAKKVMRPGLADPVALIATQRPQAAQSFALSLPSSPGLAGRILSIRVDASDGKDGHFQETAVVEYTGVHTRPFIFRSVE